MVRTIDATRHARDRAELFLSALEMAESDEIVTRR
jgi:hypothetical protein